MHFRLDVHCYTAHLRCLQLHTVPFVTFVALFLRCHAPFVTFAGYVCLRSVAFVALYVCSYHVITFYCRTPRYTILFTLLHVAFVCLITVAVYPVTFVVDFTRCVTLRLRYVYTLRCVVDSRCVTVILFARYVVAFVCVLPVTLFPSCTRS